MATIKEFEDLEIWKLSRILCNDIFKLASNSELSSDYKLFNQLNGSTGSIMDNIAEGYERNGNKEFIQYLSIAKASCGETRSQLYRVLDRNYCSEVEFEHIKNQTLVISKKIAAFITYLKRSDFKGSKFNQEP